MITLDCNWKEIGDNKFERNLGLVETFFNRKSIENSGQTDIYFRLPLNLIGNKLDFINILPLIWFKLHTLHPSLSFEVFDNKIRFDVNDLNLINSTKSLIIQNSFPIEGIEHWLEVNVWNGDRNFLSTSNLSRLIVFYDEHSPSIEIILLVAHCISDGSSVINIAHDLLNLLSLPELNKFNRSLISVPNLFNFMNFVPELHESDKFDDYQTFIKGSLIDVINRLPYSLESSYPPLLFNNKLPSKPSLRWYWAIRKVVGQIRGKNLDRLTTIELLNKKPVNQRIQPPWLTYSKWKVFRLSVDETNDVLKYAKSNGIRIGSLLFAASSIAVSNLNFRHNKNGDTCLIGFPFSLRPFLISHNRSPLSVQLGFGGIQLPLTPCYTDSNTFKLRFKNRANLSQCQFDKLLNSPTLLQDSLCSSFSRAKSFDAGHDGWKSSKPNSTGTAINASMMGSMDRLFSSEYIFKNSKICIDKERLAYIGVRCRENELLLETFTLAGQLSISLGYDNVLWTDDGIITYLEEFKRILVALTK